MQTITVTAAVQRKNILFIDTRTPQEFSEDHLPRAINIPIFSNEERAVIGTMYKQVSKEKALETGVTLFSRKLPEFMKEISKYQQQELIIYCWRGGMRSKTVTALLDSLGYTVYQLEGGHKAYRKYIREQLEQFHLKPKLVVLWGLTCTGKTKLLQHFSNSLDLEGLAQHRGSLYGAIGLQPRSQKAFENVLLQRLQELNNKAYVLIEGESRKIGPVQLPAFLYTALKQGIPVLVTRSMEKRAEHALQEYIHNPGEVYQLKEVTAHLFKVISQQHQQEALQLLERGKNLEAIRILLEY